MYIEHQTSICLDDDEVENILIRFFEGTDFNLSDYRMPIYLEYIYATNFLIEAGPELPASERNCILQDILYDYQLSETVLAEIFAWAMSWNWLPAGDIKIV